MELISQDPFESDLTALRCPLTGQALRFEPSGGGVVTSDEQIRYPVVDGVICLTIAHEPPGRHERTASSNRRHAAVLRRRRLAARIAVWQFASVPALKLYIHPWLGGRWLLRALFRLENQWSAQLGLYAQSPLILIDREPVG